MMQFINIEILMWVAVALVFLLGIVLGYDMGRHSASKDQD